MQDPSSMLAKFEAECGFGDAPVECGRPALAPLRTIASAEFVPEPPHAKNHRRIQDRLRHQTMHDEWNRMQHALQLPGDFTQIPEGIINKSETHLQRCETHLDNPKNISCRVKMGKRLRKNRIEHAYERSPHHLPCGITSDSVACDSPYQNSDSIKPSSLASCLPWRVAEMMDQEQRPRVNSKEQMPRVNIKEQLPRVNSLDSLPTVLIEKDSERPRSCDAPPASVGVSNISLPDIRTLPDTQNSRSSTRGRSTDGPLSLCDKELLGSVLRQSTACCDFSEGEIDQVTSMCTARKYNAEEVVVKYGQQWPFMCCILTGSCQVTRASGKKLGTISTRCWFGDLAHNNALATVSCISDVTLVLITQQMLQLASPPKPSSDIERLKKIEFLEQVLGEGASGKVLPCVLQNKRNKMHAVKCIQKHTIVTRKARQQILNEVNLLTQAQHPFIVKLTDTLQDPQCIYLVMEHLPGGDLFEYMTKCGALPESAAQFYIANVLCALEHLHDHQIIYRDLKPENLVLDQNGYLKLIDFGFAKKLEDNEKTYTLCGTCAYMAPEVLGREGHNQPADMWSLGVLLYELMVGAPPYNSTYDHPTLCNEIMARKLSLGVSSSPEVNDFLHCLLCIEPTERLECNKNNYHYARAHSWFGHAASVYGVKSGSAFDWEKLEQSKLEAPYIPSCSRMAYNEKVCYDAFCDRMVQRDSLEWTPKFGPSAAAGA